jgi:hypothetical protein
VRARRGTDPLAETQPQAFEAILMGRAPGTNLTGQVDEIHAGRAESFDSAGTSPVFWLDTAGSGLFDVDLGAGARVA